jgi:hypothetical protein
MTSQLCTYFPDPRWNGLCCGPIDGFGIYNDDIPAWSPRRTTPHGCFGYRLIFPLTFGRLPMPDEYKNLVRDCGRRRLSQCPRTRDPEEPPAAAPDVIEEEEEDDDVTFPLVCNSNRMYNIVSPVLSLQRLTSAGPIQHDPAPSSMVRFLPDFDWRANHWFPPRLHARPLSPLAPGFVVPIRRYATPLTSIRSQGCFSTSGQQFEGKLFPIPPRTTIYLFIVQVRRPPFLLGLCCGFYCAVSPYSTADKHASTGAGGHSYFIFG